MVITIKKMLFNNFKGILGEKEFEFAPKLTKVYGANKTGKTTLADGFYWCLFGKNSEGATNFGIKPKDINGNVLLQLDHSVTLWLDVDGREVTLQRVLVEKWGKPVGSTEKVLMGHTTNYFIDGNKYTEKDYKEFVGTFCNEALFMCITNSLYFTSLKADMQRALLTKMVGEVSNETLAEGNEEFTKLLEDMKGETLEQYMEHLSYCKKEIKAELERIPVRINEQQQGVAELMAAGTDWGTLEAEVANIDAAMQRIDDEIADRSKVEDSKYEAMAKERKAINELRSAADQLEYEHKQAWERETREHSSRERELKSIIAEGRAEEQRCNEKKAATIDLANKFEEREEEIVKRWDEVVAGFRTRWAAAKAEEFEYDENSSEFVCPTCKRRLDEEDVQEAIERMRANWNTAHAEKMSKLNAEAANIKDSKAAELNKLYSECKEYTSTIESLDASIEQAKDKYLNAEHQLNLLAANIIEPISSRVAGDEKLAKLRAEIEQRTAELEQPQQTQIDSTAGLKADKAQLKQQRDSKMLQLNNKQLIANKQKRIEELGTQEKQLNIQLAELEGKEYTAQQLLEANITELERKVNSLFTMVKFEMFDHKLNGTLKPTCECSVDGVPYSDLNNADRYNAGIDIINAICKFNDVYAPCFVDNAESINNVLPMESQQIQMLVSEDKELVFNQYK